ncbi:MAG: ATP-binding cassette domain-containing protein [Betaproteobacteria bacterium]|nr:ATP-binding cassette domain-containing protein [Betaproteobacteria bacterium]
MALFARGDLDAFRLGRAGGLARGIDVMKGGHVMVPNIEVGMRNRNYLQLKKTWVDQNPDVVLGILRAHIEANEFIKANPQKAAEYAGKKLNLPPDQIPELIRRGGFRWDVYLDTTILAELKSTIDWMREQAPRRRAGRHAPGHGPAIPAEDRAGERRRLLMGREGAVAAIQMQRVGKRFEPRHADGLAYEALAGVDLAIGEGEFLCVLGPTGCGKSTVMHLVAGFETPTEGRVLVAGKPVSGPGADRGMVFQNDRALFPWLTVDQNVAFGLEVAHRTPAAVRCG